MSHVSHVSQMFQVSHVSQVSQMSHVSQKNKAPQIVTDNISAMTIINHMGGQSHLFTLITLHLLAINIYVAGGETYPVFVRKNDDPSSKYVISFSAGKGFYTSERQILTYKDGPHAERVKVHVHVFCFKLHKYK